MYLGRENLWHVGACASQESEVRVENFYIVIHFANVLKKR